MADSAATGFDEIRSLIARLPGPDLEAGTTALARLNQLVPAPGGLGRLGELAVWLATWQGRAQPRLRRPRIALFIGAQGVAAREGFRLRVDETAKLVDLVVSSGAPVNQACLQADSDLRLFELDTDNPTGDFLAGPATAPDEAARALSYGMTAVEDGIDLLVIAAQAAGGGLAASAILSGLLGGLAADWLGDGPFDVLPEARAELLALATAATARARADARDVLDWLPHLAGLEVCAMVGAIIAARQARTPVVLDGIGALTGAAIVRALDPRLLDHCIAADGDLPAPGRALIPSLGLRSLSHLGLAAGDGAAGALGVSLLKAACDCLESISTRGEAGL